jgi:oxygen-independent coproporphyrinogen-3 oxidase
MESRHNLAYWRYGSYAGIGPGAHGRRSGTATQRHRKPENWLVALDRNGNGIAEESALQPNEQAAEALLMGLRLRDGVDLHQLAELAGSGVPEIVDVEAIARLQRQGLLELSRRTLHVTAGGALLLDAILREIVTLQ